MTSAALLDERGADPFGAGGLTVAHDLLAGHDGVQIAVGPLEEPPSPDRLERVAERFDMSSATASGKRSRRRAASAKSADALQQVSSSPSAGTPSTNVDSSEIMSPICGLASPPLNCCQPIS